jgi:type VI protein secretion system component Hcp
MTMNNGFHSNRLVPSLKGKKKVSRLCMLLMTLVFHFSLVSFALAAPTAYMFMGDIKGDSKRKGFEDAIELFGELTYGVQQDGEFEEGEVLTGRITTFSNITVEKIPDRASSAIMSAAARKTQFDLVEITIPSGRKGPDTILTLEKVIVRSVNTVVGLKGRTIEFVSFDFRKFTWEIKSNVGDYNLETNE